MEKAGRYEIELRRWPFHADQALNSTGPPKTVSGRPINPGKAVPIAAARLEVAGKAYSTKVAGSDRGATFQVSLDAGRATMHGWFQDADGKDLCGAFYARVRRVEP